MNPTAEDILRSCNFFSGLSADSLEKLGRLGKVVRFRKGERIFRQGEPCPGVYAVGSGSVRVFRLSASGKEHLLHLAEEGMTFAEVAAIGRFRCPANAEAAEDTVCALLPTDRFLGALEGDHRLCLQLLGSMAGWVRHLVGLMEDIVLRDAAGRLARYLLRQDSSEVSDVITLPMRKKDLASHLNLTSEALSRTLRRLVDVGHIELPSSRQIRICNRAGLELVAEGLASEV